MIFGTLAPRPPVPSMGWSVSGLVRSVVSAPLNIVSGVTQDVVGAAGGILGSVTQQAGGALQNLRPAAGPVAPPPASNLPLILGAGAAGLVLILLLTRRPSSAPAAP